MPNRLSQESSPYLLQHADNPVDWLPWGDDALRLAKESDRPIFLSIGYAACHWCHVMAHESFEDPATAELLNREFIPVKVDREERPDVDAVYMDAVVAMTGQGGWPLSVFLAPDGRPFFGGTYFPPVSRHRLPSFPEVLQAIARAWKEDRGPLLSAGKSLVDHLTSLASATPPRGALDPDRLKPALESLLRGYDWTNGGWGRAPKFPQTPIVLFLLDRYRRSGDRLALDMATHALTAMARGGMRDHLGGGFHRYSVDDRWTVPHFEKMLYDNALLARACVSGWRATGAAFLRSVAEETLDFLYREMLDPRGGFYSSLDADSGGGEGLFYTWTPQEVGDALQDPAEAAHACRIFHVSEQGDLDGRSVLRLTPAPPGNQDALPEEAVDASRIERLRRTMFDARARRPRPALDDKIVAAWNGLTLIACVDAALAWGRSEDLAAAENLAGFLLRELSPAGALLRSERSGRAGPAAFLEDHAAVGLGLLALYQTDFDERWYAGAVAQAEAILDRFFDGASGFFDTPSEQSSLWMRPRSVQDSPAPSGGAMAVELLQNLYALTADDRYASAATAALLGMQDTATDHPAAFATWCLDLQTETSPRRQLAVIGDPSADDFRDLLRAVRELDPPGLVLAGGTGEGSAVPLLKERTRIDGRAAAYLCEHFACRLPVTSPDELRAQLLAQKT